MGPESPGNGAPDAATSAMPSISDSVLAALSKVVDRDLGKDIVTLGFVKDLAVAGDKVSFTLDLTTPACPYKDALEAEARARPLPFPESPRWRSPSIG